MGPQFYSPFLKYKQCFHENIINNDANHKNNDISHTAPTLKTLLVKNIQTLARCGLLIIQVARHILCSTRFWCGFDWQGVFCLPAQFCKVVDFILALLYSNFMLQYLMNYSSNFNNFCRFQLLAVCTKLLW